MSADRGDLKGGAEYTGWSDDGFFKIQTVGGGYPVAKYIAEGELVSVSLGRLTYLAEYGLDALEADQEVHHKNHVPFDNRPENLEARDPGDHSRYHARVRHHGRACADGGEQP